MATIKKDEDGNLLDTIINAKGNINRVIQSYDHVTRRIIPNIIESEEIKIKQKRDETYSLVFKNVRWSSPHYYSLNGDGNMSDLYPKKARSKNMTYSATLLADIGRKIGGDVDSDENFTKVEIGKIPVMIGSSLDNLTKLNDKEKYKEGEAEKDLGGYFIISGVEKILLNIEKVRVNEPYLYEDGKDFSVRYTSSTKTDSTIVKLSETKTTLNIHFNRLDPNLNGVNIFYIFYILGYSINTIEKSKAMMLSLIHDKDPIREENRKRDFLNFIGSSEYRIKEFMDGDEKSVQDIIMNTIKNQIMDTSIFNQTELYNDIILTIRTEIFRNIPFPEKEIELKFQIVDGINSILSKIIGILPNVNGENISVNYVAGETSINRQNKSSLIRLITDRNSLYVKINSVFDKKIRLLSYMIVKYVDFKNGYREADDRDSWAIKKIDDAGEHMKSQFVSIWKSMMKALKKDIESKSVVKNIENFIKQTSMTEGFISAFRKGIWGIKKKTGAETVVVDTFNRETRTASVSHPNKVTTRSNKQGGVKKKRMINPSSWGIICPASTPEGENCGFVKDLTVATWISLYRDENVVKGYLNNYVVWLRTENRKNLVFLNGIILGFCNTQETFKGVRDLRRSGSIWFDTGIHYDKYNDLWINTLQGRACRPLLIVSDDGKDLVIDRDGVRGESLQNLLTNGALEYIDIVEQQQPYMYIAEYVDKIKAKSERLMYLTEKLDDLKNDPKSTLSEINSAYQAYVSISNEMKYTHAEVDPSAIFGLAANLIPLIERMPGPRGTYQISMSKQALGPNSARMELRYDVTFRKLAYPNVPLFVTDAHERINLDQYPAGQMAMVAVTTYGGLNQEDAIIFKESSTKRGMFETIHYNSYTIKICSQADTSEIIQYPDNLKYQGLYSEHEKDKYSKLDENGIVKLGSEIFEGDYLISKISIKKNDKGKDEVSNTSIRAEPKKTGIVDKIFGPKKDDRCTLYRITLRRTHIVKIGDKFASRYAQKGVIGDIMPDADMPQIESGNRELNGMIPDIIINPHAFPSRMTIGKIIESSVGVYSSLTGERINATAFRRVNYENYTNELERLGYSKSGKVKMRNGITGRLMDAEIFVGPVYYQALRHFVDDKIQARNVGAMSFQNRQPISGIRKLGALRFGEMERDALLSYGATGVLQDRLLYSSDVSEIIICELCGKMADIKPEFNEIRCKRCHEDNIGGRLELPHVYLKFSNLLRAGNIGLTIRNKKLN